MSERDPGRWNLRSLVCLGSATLTLAASVVAARDPLPDPTEPPTGITPTVVEVVDDKTSSLNLMAIFFADDRRLAIINDRRVMEGDSIGRARVVSIAPNHVRLLRDGEELDLALVPRDIKLEQTTSRNRTSQQAVAPPDAPASPAATPDEPGETRQ